MIMMKAQLQNYLSIGKELIWRKKTKYEIFCSYKFAPRLDVVKDQIKLKSTVSRSMTILLHTVSMSIASCIRNY